MDEALRAELVARLSDDQTAVGAVYETADGYRPAFQASQAGDRRTPWPFAIFEWEPASAAPAEVIRALHVIRSNTARLKQIVATHGWPGRSLVGEDGALAAWLILQHAGSAVSTIGTPENHAFRRSCVPLLMKAVLAGEAHPRHLAWVVDGIHAVADEPPEYAVLSSAYRIVDGEPVFAFPADVGIINARRAAIGLRALSWDVARRIRAGELEPNVFGIAGPDWWEPWPARGGGDSPDMTLPRG
jgi:hypothetical protein